MLVAGTVLQVATFCPSHLLEKCYISGSQTAARGMGAKQVFPEAGQRQQHNSLKGAGANTSQGCNPQLWETLWYSNTSRPLPQPSCVLAYHDTTSECLAMT